ncbi:MAG TPA: hypothetical protein VGC09_03385, partial [Rhodopila sp.]
GPGSWVHPGLSDPATLPPNMLGLLALGWLLSRRAWRRLPRSTTPILAAWIALCLAFLGRHYACSGAGAGVCGVFVVAAHHYHVYLQAAWASLTGLVLVDLWAMGRRRDLVPLAILAACVGLIGLFAKTEDLALRRLGSTHADLILDRAAYDWILLRTSPLDVFVTELPREPADMGPAAATVMAAGRRLIAAPAFHTNPYVDWAQMNARRTTYLKPGADLSGLLRQAGSSTAYLLLPNGTFTGAATPVFNSAFNTIYRVEPALRRTPRIPPPAP